MSTSLKIVTDSSCDLPPDVVRDLGITVVPLSIHFGDRAYVDGEDIDAATFYRMLATEPVHPRTSQPPAGRFEEAYRALAAAGHDVLAITIASGFSGTFNSASVAARNTPDARVTVIDSRTASMATGSMVIRAAEMARDGRDLAEIEATIPDMMTRLRVYLVVDTLTYLQRGGRIGRASSLLGTMLNIKPIITVHDGEVAPLQRVRTRSKAIAEMVNLVKGQLPLEEAYVLHTAAPELAEEFAAVVRPLFGDCGLPILPLGPVVGVHIGPGAVGIVLLRQDQS